jgi:tetratricopeptide (TPR) repeat protein
MTDYDLDVVPPHNRAYVWLKDRFCTTYLSEWHPSSHKMEWKYIHGEYVAPCLDQDMATRRVDREELARLIASHACKPGAEDEFAHTDLASRYGPLALQLLKSGQWDNAARLFEVAAQVSPQVSTYNNWAFCLIPHDPARSLALLGQAIDLGGADNRLVVANRLLCYFLLKKYAAGLEYADDVITRAADLFGVTGRMWSLERPEEVVSTDLTQYIRKLIVMIAAKTEDAAVIARWEKSVEVL